MYQETQKTGSLPYVFFKIQEVMKSTALSRSVIYAKMKKGQFPNQIKLGEKTSVWKSTDIQAWMDNQHIGQATAKKNPLSAL